MSETFTPPIAETINNEALYRKIRWRVAPLLVLMFLIAFLDRVNISFAALTMNRDLGLSETIFGIGAGIFFVGYSGFGVPANLMLERLGVRRWMATIMVTWGVISASMAFVHGPAMYLTLRLLLGAAEAGCFPGLVLYLTYWLPASARARMNALFVISIPLSSVVGAPISSAILRHQHWAAFGLSLKPWQALFILEALPAIVLGLFIPLLLAEGPNAVKWLSSEEKLRLNAAIAADAPPTDRHASWHHALRGRAGRLIVLLAVMYFAFCTGLYALGFWVPKILTSRGVSLASVGWLTALPFLFGAVGMLLSGASSDRLGDRRWHMIVFFILGASGVAFTALTHGLAPALIGLVLASVGVFASLPVFWTSATEHMSTASRPVGVGFINSVGNTAGLVGPAMIGTILQHTGSYKVGLLFTAGLILSGAVLSALIRDRARGHNDDLAEAA